MRLRVLDTGLASARRNVAIGAALLASVDEGAPATLRFHRYPLSCVIGRNQDVELELDLPACREAGVEIARRVTGGGAVVMGPGVLAFDLVLPASDREAFALSRRAGTALVVALRALGFDAVLATPGSVEIGGLKVSGSAGRLGRRSALHQATLILDLARTAPLALLRRRTESGRPTADPRHRVGELGLRFPSARLPPPPCCAWSPSPSNSAVAEFDIVERARRAGPTCDGGGDEAAPFASPPPPGEGDRPKGGGGGTRALSVEESISMAMAEAFDLEAYPGELDTAKLARAGVLLSRDLGCDAYVFRHALDWEDAA